MQFDGNKSKKSKSRQDSIDKNTAGLRNTADSANSLNREIEDSEIISQRQQIESNASLTSLMNQSLGLKNSNSMALNENGEEVQMEKFQQLRQLTESKLLKSMFCKVYLLIVIFSILSSFFPILSAVLPLQESQICICSFYQRDDHRFFLIDLDSARVSFLLLSSGLSF